MAHPSRSIGKGTPAAARREGYAAGCAYSVPGGWPMGQPVSPGPAFLSPGRVPPLRGRGAPWS